MVVCIPFAVANVISPWIICYDYNGSGLRKLLISYNNVGVVSNSYNHFLTMR